MALLFFFFFYIYLFWEREWRRGREGGPGSKLGSVLTAESLIQGLNPHTEILTWAKVGCSTDWATQSPILFLFFFLSLFIHFERETERASGEGTEREGERESQADCMLSGQSPMWGLIPWSMIWPQLKPRVRHLTDWATQVPQGIIFH